MKKYISILSFPAIYLFIDVLTRFKYLKSYDGKQAFFYFLSLIFSFSLIFVGIHTIKLLTNKKFKYALIALLSLHYTVALIFSYGFYYYNNIFPNYYTIEFILSESKNSLIIFLSTLNLFSILIILAVYLLIFVYFYSVLKYERLFEFYRKKSFVLHIIIMFVILLVLNNNIRFVDQSMIVDTNFIAVNNRYIYNKISGKEFGGSGLLARNPMKISNIANPQNKLNVLVIVFESLRRQNLSLYEYNRPTTPNLVNFSNDHKDEFFKFNKSFTVASTTMLAVPAIFSGVSSFQEAIKVHQYPLLWDYGRANGMKTFYITSHSFLWYNLNIFYSNEKYDYLYNKEISKLPYYNDVGANDDATVEAFEKHVQTIGKNPFLGVLHFNTNHYPYKVPKGFQKWNNGLMDNYDNSILYQDYLLGKVFDFLKQKGLLENTAVIMTSDHGEAFREHGSIGHIESNYIEEISIPIMLYLPRAFHKNYNMNFVRENINKNIANIDVMPTVLDFLQIKDCPEIKNITKNLKGYSLLDKVDENRPIIVLNNNEISRYKVGVSILKNNYHYMYRINVQPHTEELYDLGKDQWEKDNILNKVDKKILLDMKNTLMQYKICRDVFNGKL